MILSSKLLARLGTLYELGVPKETVDLTKRILESLNLDDSRWAVFANLEEDPPFIEIHDTKTGARLEICILK